MIRQIFITAIIAFALIICGCTQELPQPGNLPAETTQSTPPPEKTTTEFPLPVIPPEEKTSPPENPTPPEVKPETPPVENQRQTLEIKAYFPDDAGLNLVAVKRKIEFTGNLEKYSNAVQILMTNPSETDLTGIFPKNAKLNGVTFKDGTAYVDFGSSITKNFVGGSTGEELLVNSVVDTLTEFPEVKRVQFLVEGEEIETLAGHMDLSAPLTRDGNSL